ncbi:4Fe-4S cluster-binding domain-containing protein [Loigolactobacillus bifermentans]|nr:4Fe-4S cluster-binding domain-containing protein [Loigolactobacillus bifermentans]QGG59455.1 radical SAM protein [Loigolactobacillus bifermentans]
MDAPYVFNIQKFSTHDGPGIRTTIFFKGCPLHCDWCHNPESQRFEPEKMLDKDQHEQIMGRQYSIDELVRIMQADQIFYDQSGGGVTFSGGEVLAQNRVYVSELARRLQEIGISVAIDTCGAVPWSQFEAVLPYSDIFLYDLKFIDSQLHERYTGAPNILVLENLKRLSAAGAAIYLRLILLEGLNTTDEMLQRLQDWLQQEGIQLQEIDLLPYHDFGRDKYAQLGRVCTQHFKRPSDDQIAMIQQRLTATHANVQVGG